MLITEALPGDHKELTNLTIAAKFHWDYSEAQIKEWIPVLTISPEYIEQKNVFKLIEDEHIIGYYSYFFSKEDEVLLDNIFVHPQFIGKGIGHKLMTDFLERIESERVSSILLYSDPNAEAFYAQFGFDLVGKEPTSIKNRFLPILRKKLS